MWVLHVTKPRSVKLFRRFQAGTAAINALGFCPRSGGKVVFGLARGRVRPRHLVLGSLASELSGPASRPGGAHRRLVSQRVACLQRRRRLRPRIKVIAHTGPDRTIATADLVRSLAFADDGTVLVSGGDDWNVTTWDVATGRPFGPPRTQAAWSPVNDVAVSSDGRTIAAAGTEGVDVWPLNARGALATTVGSLGYADERVAGGDLGSRGRSRRPGRGGVGRRSLSLETLVVGDGRTAAASADDLEPGESRRRLLQEPARSRCGQSDRALADRDVLRSRRADRGELSGRSRRRRRPDLLACLQPHRDPDCVRRLRREGDPVERRESAEAAAREGAAEGAGRHPRCRVQPKGGPACGRGPGRVDPALECPGSRGADEGCAAALTPRRPGRRLSRVLLGREAPRVGRRRPAGDLLARRCEEGPDGDQGDNADRQQQHPRARVLLHEGAHPGHRRRQRPRLPVRRRRPAARRFRGLPPRPLGPACEPDGDLGARVRAGRQVAPDRRHREPGGRLELDPVERRPHRARRQPSASSRSRR